ncbi:sulfatase family protein [Pontiella sulfatireligans]|nr:sulfatase [Pontiella sulfatireligans]
MKKFAALSLLVVAAGVVHGMSSVKGVGECRPNIVFFLADDQSKFDHSAYGNEKAPTPVTGKFAKEGVVFERMFTGQAICAPSRSMLYTGLNPIRNGCFLNHTQVRPGVKSITKYMGNLGYEVILAGKSHVAPDEQFQWTKRFQPVKVPGLPRPWIPVEEMEAFMKNPGDKPFCMIVASEFPHSPHIKDTSFGVEEVKVQSFIADTPDARKSYTQYYQSIVEKEKEFEAVLGMIDKHGLRDDTVVFYADDHGGKRGKFTVYDSGLNVAFMVRWPGKIKPGRTGALSSFTDFVPTAIELAGGTVPAGIDGKSLLPVLTRGAVNQHDYVYGVAHNQGIQQRHVFPQRSVHDGRYHYIVNFNSLEKIESDRTAGKTIDYFFEHGAKKHSSQPTEELYDTQVDPDELVNLAGREETVSIKAKLREQLFQWLEMQGDYLGEDGPVVFLQGKQHELDEQAEKYGYKIPAALVGSLNGLKNDPHAITGEDAKAAVVADPVVPGDGKPQASNKNATSVPEGAPIEDFLENKRKYCTKQGKEFSETKYLKSFAKLDANKDGLLSAGEWSPGKK